MTAGYPDRPEPLAEHASWNAVPHAWIGMETGRPTCRGCGAAFGEHTSATCPALSPRKPQRPR